MKEEKGRENNFDLYSTITDIKNRQDILQKNIYVIAQSHLLQQQNIEKMNAKLKFLILQNHYDEVKKRIFRKFSSGQKIKVGFAVIYSATFTAQKVFELMVDDDLFEPIIIVLRGTGEDEHYLQITFNKTYEELREKYPNYVNKGYDFDKNICIDYTDQLDLIYVTSSIDSLLPSEYQARYLITKNLLPFHVPFSIFSSNHTTEIFKLETYNTYWKVFLENRLTYFNCLPHHYIDGANLVITGYPKLDYLAECHITKRTRKRIIIALQYVISTWKNRPFGSFFEYQHILKKIPYLFPDIDFVFRPHPFLEKSLEEKWGKEKTKVYFDKLISYKNVIISREGDYSHIFMNSDAMIHDCESFMAGYLYTNKPVCSIHSPIDISERFTEFGKMCFDQHYFASEPSEIIDFIKNVVVDGNDIKYESRKKFAKELMYNFPNAASAIIKHIKEELGVVCS